MKFFTTTTLIISISLIGIGLTQKDKLNRKIRTIFNLNRNYEFDCEAYEKNQYSSSLNNFLKDYILVSEREGVKASADLKSLRRKIRAGQLVGVPEKKSFILDTFQFSYAVLTPYSKNLLDTIGIRFEKALIKTPLEGTKLIVTSMTRTLYTVSKLVKNNRTAVKRSPHLNGNSFDFSFSRFNTTRAIDNCELTFLQETISKILLDLKNEKRCWVTFERWEECLHVVAKK
jgi:hypothetical protein